MHTYHVHYPQTYERSRLREPLHCFSTLSRSMLICLAPRDLYSPADLIGPQQRGPAVTAVPRCRSFGLREGASVVRMGIPHRTGSFRSASSAGRWYRAARGRSILFTPGYYMILTACVSCPASC